MIQKTWKKLFNQSHPLFHFVLFLTVGFNHKILLSEPSITQHKKLLLIIATGILLMLCRHQKILRKINRWKIKHIFLISCLHEKEQAQNCLMSQIVDTKLRKNKGLDYSIFDWSVACISHMVFQWKLDISLKGTKMLFLFSKSNYSIKQS